MAFPIPLIAALLGTALGGTGLAYGGARIIENIAGGQPSPTVRATTAPVNIRARGGAQGGSPQPQPAQPPAVQNIPIQGSRSPDTPYPAIRAMYGEPNPAPAVAPTVTPRATPKTAPKTVKKAPAPQAKRPAPQGGATVPIQEDPFTQAQRMVNGTEQIPVSAVAPVSDPVEDRYQLLLKMYGITPDNTAAPNGMPDTMARQAGLNTGATSGVFNPEAALQYYGGDQAVYDALARMYGW